VHGCAPGLGASAAYQANSMQYFAAASARAQLEAREAYLKRKAANAQARLNAAEDAYKQGEIRVATRILGSVTKPGTPDKIRMQAMKRLGELGDEANQKLREIETGFEKQRAELSPGDVSYATRWPELVRDLFKKYDHLTDDYGEVPRTGHEIEETIARKRLQTEYATVLNEPRSAALWQLGQKHEQQDHACCAYWVYKEAVRLVPAPSALLAQRRLEVMEQDSQLREAAEACRSLQECHRMYRAAEQILASNPERARRLLTQIIEKAPSDSELYRAVSLQLVTMPR
jgi:hypothetical protein